MAGTVVDSVNLYLNSCLAPVRHDCHRPKLTTIYVWHQCVMTGKVLAALKNLNLSCCFSARKFLRIYVGAVSVCLISTFSAFYSFFKSLISQYFC